MTDAELLTKSPGLPWMVGVSFVLMRQLLDGSVHYQKDQVMTRKRSLQISVLSSPYPLERRVVLENGLTINQA